MSRHPLHAGAAMALGLLLAACGNGNGEVEPVRPAMVVQPVPTAAAFESFAGEVRARHEPALAFRIGGKVARRHVEVGDRVRAGQVLAELDPEDARLQVEAARAQLDAAEADLELARAERERYLALVGQQLVSRSLFEARDNAFRAAQARVEQTRAQYEVARNQAGYTRLAAPADGVIAQRLVEAGQVVAAGQTVFVLAQDGEREVVISLPEQQVGQFAIGLPVTVVLWSRENERFPGTLRELAPAADPQSRTFAARVAFTADAAVELGQSARVYVARNGQVELTVPLSAIHAEDGAPFVWRVDPASRRVRRVAVDLGPYGEDRVPVRAGLEPGDWIVAAGVHLLREGQQVRPVDRENREVALVAGQP